MPAAERDKVPRSCEKALPLLQDVAERTLEHNHESLFQIETAFSLWKAGNAKAAMKHYAILSAMGVVDAEMNAAFLLEKDAGVDFLVDLQKSAETSLKLPVPEAPATAAVAATAAFSSASDTTSIAQVPDFATEPEDLTDLHKARHTLFSFYTRHNQPKSIDTQALEKTIQTYLVSDGGFHQLWLQLQKTYSTHINITLTEQQALNSPRFSKLSYRSVGAVAYRVGEDIEETKPLMFGRGPFRFEAVLPAGFVIDSTTGAISGAPRAAGTGIEVSVFAKSQDGWDVFSQRLTVADERALSVGMDEKHYSWLRYRFTAALQLYNQSAAQGDAEAARKLGDCFFHELGSGWEQSAVCPKDIQQAAVHYERAAKANDTRAYYNLGQIHENGEGPFAANISKAMVRTCQASVGLELRW